MILKATIGTFIGAVSLLGANWISERLEPRIVERLVHVEVEAPKPDLKTLIKEVPPKYDISPLLAAAIVERESNGKMDAVRFEPSQVARARKVAGTKNEDQIHQYASSHCAMQIMGWHAPKFGLSWADLYEPRTCVEVSMSILKDCMDRNAGKPRFDQIHSALACYNGSEVYADAIEKRLGRLLIEQML